MLKLIQGYYHFLSLGKFMEGVILSNDLSKIAIDYPVKTSENSSFLIKKSLLSSLLSSCHANPDKRNVYGYLLEISAFKGIFSSIRELIESNAPFRNFLKTKLGDQYFPFEQSIRFLRNVLNHATTEKLEIKIEDFDIQRDYILSPKVQRVNTLKKSAKINLNFIYAEHIPEWQGSQDYGVHFTLDFNLLKPGIQLESLISRHNLYLLAELCFNLAQIHQFQTTPKHSPTTKTPHQPKTSKAPSRKKTKSESRFRPSFTKKP